jgi:hypothetical protein
MIFISFPKSGKLNAIEEPDTKVAEQEEAAPIMTMTG